MERAGDSLSPQFRDRPAADKLSPPRQAETEAPPAFFDDAREMLSGIALPPGAIWHFEGQTKTI